MIVKAKHPRGRSKPFCQVFANVGHAVAIGVLKHGVVWRVHHIQRAVVPYQSEDGGQPITKYRFADRLAVLVELYIQDAIELLGGGAAHVHRIFAHEQIPLVVAGHHRRMLDVRGAINQIDLKAGRRFLRGCGAGRSKQCYQTKNQKARTARAKRPSAGH